jgi:small-conductance mechanosensitive channel
LQCGSIFESCRLMDKDAVRVTPPKTTTGESFVKKTIKLSTYIILMLACGATWLLLKLHIFEGFGAYRVFAAKLCLGGMFGFLILAISKLTESVIVKRAKNRSNRYNLLRLLRLVSFLLFIGVIISFLFAKWYGAVVSLGLISLILGFALQTPITSFIGWINILVRAPYHVGDRIQIGEFKGDVVEINYLDTTLWEFGGDYLTNDVPSGRLIRFPNSLVLEAAVYNYSWRKFPYIWNEIPFHVAYESDLAHVMQVIREVATKELGPEMTERIKTFKQLVKQSEVDELDVKEYPFISLRVNANTWVEVVVTYLVPPRQAAVIRTRMIKEMIAELMKSPDKVMFPRSNAR